MAKIESLPKYVTTRWRLFLPILHLRICIPFIEIQTVLMGDHAHSFSREYVLLRLRVFKWAFEIDLYDTERRRIERETMKGKDEADKV